MVKIKIIIGPPFCNQGECIIEGIHYPKNSFVTTSQEIQTIINNNESETIKGYDCIVVFGFNGTKKERDDVINYLKYLFDEIDEEYYLLDIPQENILYKMFLSSNTDILGLYIYYDCLELPEEDKTKRIKVKMEYDELLKNGSSAVIVDIHPLFLNSTNTRIMLNIPDKDSIFINHSLCDYLSKLSSVGFLVILSHCEYSRYSELDLCNLINIYDVLIKNIDFEISGFNININKKMDERYYKPHPWHLFKIFKEYYINPKSSFYIGYQDIDKKFSDFSGISSYIDCSTPKKANELDKHFESLI